MEKVLIVQTDCITVRPAEHSRRQVIIFTAFKFSVFILFFSIFERPMGQSLHINCTLYIGHKLIQAI